MPYAQLTAVSIDDSAQNLMLIEAYCDAINLKTKNFTSPHEGLAYLQKKHADIVFVDYMMPELDGIDLITQYRKHDTKTPIIMITAASDNFELKMNALNAGATDFLTKPLNLAEFQARTRNLLDLRLAQILLEDKAKLLQEEVKKATLKVIEREHETLKILGKTAEYKDPETASHVARVAHYSKLIAQAYGLDEHMQEIIFYASPFHDIGKVGISDAILLKPGKLDDDEFDTMREHAKIGYEILKDSNSEYLKEGAIISLSHHEKFNGFGYPNRIKGDDIPLSGRITAIADVFDALTSVRPYKKAWTFDDAVALLKKESGEHFDPTLVDLFIENLHQVKEIYTRFSEA